VAIGIINRILEVEDSKQGISQVPIEALQQALENDGAKVGAAQQPQSIVPQAPPRSLRQEIGGYARKR